LEDVPVEVVFDVPELDWLKRRGNKD